MFVVSSRLVLFSVRAVVRFVVVVPSSAAAVPLLLLISIINTPLVLAEGMGRGVMDTN